MDGMPQKRLIPIFDGHNDVLIRLDDGKRDFFRRGEEGHIDLPRAREGGLAGGFFAVFTQAEGYHPDPEKLPLDPPTPDLAYAQRRTIQVMARLFKLVEQSNDQLRVVRTASDIEECIAGSVLAALLHIEGAEAIDPEMEALEVFYQAGLRSLGLVWSRPNIFGCGVPFEFHRTPDTGPGLTASGKELVKACNRLGILIDLSHLNERGFWDVAEVTDAPLVATHSNAWTITPSTRNLTDRQLDAIRDSDGMVGVNFAVGFIRPDCAPEADTPLDMVVRHFEYLVDRLGIDRVGFGSDFDGALIPIALGDAAGLPRLIDALANHGYDDVALRKLAHENWIRVLRKTWGS
jgi:membrane dipeptidase